jgi:hypothetical protein
VPPQSSARWSRFGKAVAFQAALLAGTLAFCEVVLRVIDLRYLRTMADGVGAIYQYDPDIGWLPRPHSEATYVSSARKISVKHNSLGLRDIEPQQTGKPAIAFVGDSFVWGYDAEVGERFTDIVRSRLTSHRVVNMGVSGFGTDQEYLLLKRMWPRIAPKTVVYVHCTDNDRRNNSTNSWRDGPYKPYFVRDAGGSLQLHGTPAPWSRQLYFAHNSFVRHSWVARVIVSGLVLISNPVVTVPDPTEALVDMMHDHVTTQGARFLVALQRRAPQLEAHLAMRKIPFVTLEQAENYAVDGDHWTPKGNAYVADRALDLLAENGVIRKPEGSARLGPLQ